MIPLIHALIPLGLQAFAEVMQAEVAQLAGARYSRTGGQPHCVRWGHQPGSIFLADQKQEPLSWHWDLKTESALGDNPNPERDTLRLIHLVRGDPFHPFFASSRHDITRRAMPLAYSSNMSIHFFLKDAISS